MIARELFADYGAQPSTERLIGLLRACADPVYNVCYQVLGHRQDAEDAAQIVLLKVVAEIQNPSSIERFNQWLYRVSLNTALHCRTKRTRRIQREHRVALMAQSERIPDDTRDAVLEAVADLDDDARALVVEHFFEGRSLYEMGRDRGLSAVAIWKRINRAKDFLRQSLQGMGAVAALERMDDVFGACRSVRAPSGLVSEAIIQKARAAVAAEAALMGGIVMAGKGVSVAVVAAACIALFVLGAGGALLVRSVGGASEESTAVGAAPGNRGNAAALPLAQVEPRSEKAAPSAPTPAPAAAPEALAPGLREVRTLLRRAKSEKDQGRSDEIYRQMNERWAVLRPVALSNAATFMSTLRDPENADIRSDLVALLLNCELKYCFYFIRYADDLPREILDGLANMISTGTASEKTDVLQHLGCVRGEGQALLGDCCVTLLASEKDPELLSTTLNTLALRARDLNARLEQRLDVVQVVWQTSRNCHVREECLEALSWMNSQAGESLFIEKVGEVLENRDSAVAVFIPEMIRRRLVLLPAGADERYAPVVQTALSTLTDAGAYVGFLELAIDLPPAKAITLLEGAEGRCPSASIQAGVNRALELLRRGENRFAVLLGALKAKP
jgi:RNA polymerase sigma-70 factor (ECF subfamily)